MCYSRGWRFAEPMAESICIRRENPMLETWREWSKMIPRGWIWNSLPPTTEKSQSRAYGERCITRWENFGLYFSSREHVYATLDTWLNFARKCLLLKSGTVGCTENMESTLLKPSKRYGRRRGKGSVTLWNLWSTWKHDENVSKVKRIPIRARKSTGR